MCKLLSRLKESPKLMVPLASQVHDFAVGCLNLEIHAPRYALHAFLFEEDAQVPPGAWF